MGGVVVCNVEGGIRRMDEFACEFGWKHAGSIHRSLGSRPLRCLMVARCGAGEGVVEGVWAIWEEGMLMVDLEVNNNCTYSHNICINFERKLTRPNYGYNLKLIPFCSQTLPIKFPRFRVFQLIFHPSLSNLFTRPEA